MYESLRKTSKKNDKYYIDWIETASELNMKLKSFRKSPAWTNDRFRFICIFICDLLIFRGNRRFVSHGGWSVEERDSDDQ